MRIGDYEIGDKLGRGAMGHVWLARDAKGRELALKTLSAVLAGKDPAYVARFVREAKAACTLAHPCVVQVYEMGVADGVHYIAMEYAAGGSVADLLTQQAGALPVDHALAIVRDVASGLGAAAAQGLVHRDIKPANILLRTDGSAMLGDLGLVRATEGELSNTLTLTGATLGTPAYMSPEQAHDAKTADVRSDIYSLGATLYQMATGTLPFAGDTGIDIMLKQVEEPLPDPRSRNPQLDERTARIIIRMMAKHPADRFQSAAELLRALDPGNALEASAEQSGLKLRIVALVAMLVVAAMMTVWQAGEGGSAPQPAVTPPATPVTSSHPEAAGIFSNVEALVLGKGTCGVLALEGKNAQKLLADDQGRVWSASWQGESKQGRVLVWGHTMIAIQDEYFNDQMRWLSRDARKVWCNDALWIGAFRGPGRLPVESHEPFTAAPIKAGDIIIISPRTTLSTGDIAFLQGKVSEGCGLMVFIVGWTQKNIATHPFNRLLAPYQVQFTREVASGNPETVSVFGEAGEKLRELPVLGPPK